MKTIEVQNEVIVTIPMEDLGPYPYGGHHYKVPETFEGIEITRALGRCAGGSHLVTVKTARPPTADLVLRTTGGKPYYVCVRF